MPIYGVVLNDEAWTVYDSLGVSSSGVLWETNPESLSTGIRAHYDRGFYSLSSPYPAARINVHRTNLKTGVTDLVHSVGAYAGSDNYVALSLTSTPDGSDVLFAWATDADSWLLHLSRSTDYGETWSSVSKPTFTDIDEPGYWEMWRIAYNPEWLFRGYIFDSGQIYKSTDYGATWSANINVPPNYCASRLPSTFLNYDTILLESPQNETYFPGGVSSIYALNLVTNAITEYLLADNEADYLGDNARHRSFGSICRMDSQPPTETESHGTRDDPAILSTETGLITNTDASTFVALTKTEWQDIQDCYGFPVPQALGGTSANSYLCFNRNGTVGVVMPKIPGISSVDFWFNTGDEKLYGVEVPAAGDYASAVPATWALNDINGEVTTDQVWATPTGGTTTIYNTATFDRGFYTLTKSPDGGGSIFQLYRTDVFAAPYSELLQEIAYVSAYTIRSVICSSDGQEILVRFGSTTGDYRTTKTIRSFDYGETFSESDETGVLGLLFDWHRYSGSTETVFAWDTFGDADDLVRSENFGATNSDLPLANEPLNRMPSSPTFYYGNKAIQTSQVDNFPDDDIVWAIANLSTGVVTGTTPVAMIAGSAITPLSFAWKSFGCCNLPPTTGGYATTANPPVVVTANEIIYYNSRTGIFDGTTQPIKDCYGFPIDKTYGFCRGASTLVFNESGTIGLAPNIDGDFLIYLAPDYSQFFTSFVLSDETNLRPE